MITSKAPQLDFYQRSCIAVRLGTDSMEPWLHCNDWLFIDPTDQTLADGLVAFELPDEIEPRIYRVQNSHDEHVLLKLDNPRYDDQRISLDRARLLLLGRVRGILKTA